MEGFTQKQAVDLEDSNPILIRSQPIIKGDTHALNWIVTVRKGGQPIDLSKAEIALYCARALDEDKDESGGTTYSDAAGTSDGVVTAQLPKDAANIPGMVGCTIRATLDGVSVTLARMSVMAIDPIGSDIIDEGKRIPNLDEVLAAVARCESAAAEAEGAAKAALASASNADDKANLANTAASAATKSAKTADASAKAADAATKSANAAAKKIDDMTVTATGLAPGEAPTAVLTDKDGHYNLALGLTKGDTGDSGVYMGEEEPTDPDVNVWIDPNGAASGIVDEQARESIKALKEDLAQLDTIVGYTFQNGYYTTNNQFVIDDTGRRSVTDYLFCKGGSTVEVMGDTANQYVNVVVFFDESKTPISGVSNIGARNEYHTVNIPQGSVYIRVVKDNPFNFGVKFKESGIVYQINETKKSVNELAEKQKTKEKVSPYTKYVDSISDNDVIELRVPAVKYDYVLTFSANVTTFNSIKISRDLGTWTACYMVIDSTNFYIYSGQSLVYQKAHELNITDRLSVSLIAKNDLTAKVIVNTVGGSFTKDNLVWNGSKEPFKVQSIGSTLTKCELKYMCNAIWYDIWGFGDSYFDMWVQNARALGFSNWLVDGYTGRGSIKALESLNMLLELRKPKVIAWFMGMNDPDTSTSVNENWLNTFNQVKTICEENNIDLWLCTIPNVPNRNNSLKNNVITSSSYRYVNVNNAVGGNVTSNWFDGLLSSDNVHPSELGRDRIANAVANAFPELYKIN